MIALIGAGGGLLVAKLTQRPEGPPIWAYIGFSVLASLIGGLGPMYFLSRDDKSDGVEKRKRN